MKLQELVKFNQQGFFDGAVQLGWFQNQIDKANIAAKAFIFHGPQYHGAINEQDQHSLKDSASVLVELIESLVKAKQGREDNPYWLATAGYGAGKSHLALTLATLLSKPTTPLSNSILENIQHVDAHLGQRVKKSIETLNKPSLVIALDGMGNFHLGNQLNKVVLKQLEIHNINDQAIRELSPRFATAQRFVERSYQALEQEFTKVLSQYDQATILKALAENDEDIYSGVDQVFLNSTGSAIPVDGQESAQDLLQTLCDEYCGEDKPFGNIVLLFDEFGRYLEYAADRPDLAGDSTLQQIFQGIQDNANKIRFIGFIQYELKTYLKRFNAKNSRQLQRYITRFDTANKIHLSSNLETIFANIIHKDETALNQLMHKHPTEDIFHQSWLRLAQYIPKSKLYPVWNEEKLFSQVIAKGCWPLHPLATWLLTRQDNTVQSRSALTFIKDLLSKNAEIDVFDTHGFFQVSAAELVQDYLLDEMLAAERDTGASVIETLQTLLHKFDSALTSESARTLTAIAILQNLKLRQLTQFQANELLQELTNFDEIKLVNQTKVLSEIGAAEWNNDLNRYELLTDGASRASFNIWMRKASAQFSTQDIADLFIHKSADIGLGYVDCTFSQKNNISTPDWIFEPRSYLARQINSHTLDNLIDEWLNNHSYKDAKGRIIYLYLNSTENLNDYKIQLNQCIEAALTKHKLAKLPFLFVYLADEDDSLGHTLARLKALENMQDTERHQFMRFIQEEQEDILIALKNITATLLKNREYVVPKIPEPPKERLANIATIIFEFCYPATIPFVFDGFRVNKATASADILKIFNILVPKKFSIAWLQGQSTPLNNRFDTLFKKEWKAINLQTGRLIAPQEPKTRAAFDFLATTLAIKPDIDLKTLQEKFVRPPYGFNDCSFALLFALYLTQDTPQYRIVYQKQSKNIEEWLSLVTSKTQGLLLNTNIFADTQLQPMTMSIRDEWIYLFNAFSLEKNPKMLLKYYEEIEEKKKVDSIPVDLEAQYNLLLNQFRMIYEEHKKNQNEFDDILSKLLRATDSNDIRDYTKILTALPKFIRMSKDIIEKKSFIELPLAVSVEELIAKSRLILAQKFNRFIDDLVLISHQEINIFRGKSESYQKAFSTLQMQKEAHWVQDKTLTLIQRVEERERFKYLLQDIESYIHTSPNKMMQKKDLQDLIQEGERLIKDMQSKPTIFDSNNTFMEKQNRIIDVQNSFRETITEFSKQFSTLYAGFNQLEDLNNRILQADRLLTFYFSTDEYAEILKIKQQLEFTVERIKAWTKEGFASKTLSAMLNYTMNSDLNALNAYLSEQQIDAEWDYIEEIFEPIRDELVQKARMQSDNWIHQTLGEITFANENLALLKTVLTKLENRPTIFDEDQLDQIDKLKQNVEEKYKALHMKTFNEWFENIKNQVIQYRQDDAELVAQRTKLQKTPQLLIPLFKEEEERVKVLHQEISSALDIISIEDLVQRINRLQPELREKLFTLIKQ